MLCLNNHVARGYITLASLSTEHLPVSTGQTIKRKIINEQRFKHIQDVPHAATRSQLAPEAMQQKRSVKIEREALQNVNAMVRMIESEDKPANILAIRELLYLFTSTSESGSQAG